MRFRLVLDVNRHAFGSRLPINYQYEQSAAIYRILSSADESYAEWLHDNGFRLESGKTFKLFTYSRFKIDEYFLTEVNTQEFLVILKKQDFDKKTIINEYYDNFNELIEKNKILEHNTKYKQQVNNIMIQLEKLREENNYLKKEINSLENCVSMKITKPLRTIKNIIKNKS